MFKQISQNKLPCMGTTQTSCCVCELLSRIPKHVSETTEMANHLSMDLILANHQISLDRKENENMVNFPLKKQGMITRKYWDEFPLADARTIPRKCQADHVSLLLKLLQRFSTAFTIEFQFLPATEASWWSGPCYFCSLRPCLCPGVLRQPAQHHLSPPSICLECSCSKL